MNVRSICLACLFAIAVTGCSNHAELDAAAQSASGQMERSAAIGALVHDYQQARAAQQWELALSYADQLQRLAPNSPLASTVQATVIDTGMRADEAKDRSRLAALWSYKITNLSDDGSDGVLVTAAIESDGKSDPEGVSPARLVFRNNQKLGRSLNLDLDQGRFDCASECKLSVQFDDQPSRSLTVSRVGENGQALSINDEKSIRDALDKVRVVTIYASVDGKPRTLSFDVGGFDRVQLDRKIQ